jgi:hypothetical protein
MPPTLVVDPFDFVRCLRYPRRMTTNREAIERYGQVLAGTDLAAIEALRHPDFVEDWPQSGERIRGRGTMRAIDEAHPERPTEGGPIRVVGSEDKWVLTPTFTTLRIEGTGDVYTLVLKAIYPPDSLWYITSIVELRDQLVWRVQTFFAEAYEAPKWRLQWVEKLNDAERDGP